MSVSSPCFLKVDTRLPVHEAPSLGDQLVRDQFDLAALEPAVEEREEGAGAAAAFARLARDLAKLRAVGEQLVDSLGRNRKFGFQGIAVGPSSFPMGTLCEFRLPKGCQKFCFCLHFVVIFLHLFARSKILTSN